MYRIRDVYCYFLLSKVKFRPGEGCIPYIIVRSMREMHSLERSPKEDTRACRPRMLCVSYIHTSCGVEYRRCGLWVYLRPCIEICARPQNTPYFVPYLIWMVRHLHIRRLGHARRSGSPWESVTSSTGGPIQAGNQRPLQLR